MNKWKTQTSNTIDDDEMYTSGYIQVMENYAEPEEIVIEDYYYDEKGMVIRKTVKRIKNKQNKYSIEPNVWYINRGYSPYPEIT